jgi:sec-independent protein translocase protein TatC
MKKKRTAKTRPAGDDSFIAHLIELRNRLLRALVGVLAVFLCLLPFANPIYTALAGPLTRSLPQGGSMIAIDVASPFLIPFKMAFLLALVLAIPWVLYQIWAFVAPGLYKHERQLVFPLIASSTLLFYTGMAFAYFLVFPTVFGFFTAAAPEGVAVMTDISRYLDFVLALFLAFGGAFEVPVATVILVQFGITTPDQLVEKRPYVIVGAFVIGAVLTPPDVLSQVMLAVPMWLLYEIGIVFSRMVYKRKLAREAAEAEPASDLSPHSGSE